MFKLAFYLILAGLGILATFWNPLYGGVACVLSYLLNPVAISMDSGGFRFQLWVSIAFLVSMVLYRPRPAGADAPTAHVLAGMWLFMALCAASAAWAVVSSQNALEESFEMFKRILLAALMCRLVRSERDIVWLVWASLIGTFHASALHIFGGRLGWIPASESREYGVLPTGQTAVLILFVPLLVVLGAMGRKKERLASWCILPFVLDSIVNTFQRMGFVVLAAEAVLLAIYLPRRIVIRVVPVVAVLGCLFVIRFMPPEYRDWVATVEKPHQEASAESRFAIDRASIQMLLDYPMGVGYRNYLDVSPRYLPAEMLDHGKRSAHNSFFAVLCELGIQGLLAWLWTFGGAIILMRRIRKAPDREPTGRLELYALGIELGLYGWLIGGLFHDLHNVDPAYWFVAFAVALTRLKRARPESEEAACEVSTDTMSAEPV
jgi:O-antigen ligase